MAEELNIPNFKLYNLESTFQSKLAAGEVDEKDLSFIKETGKIYTQGGEYGGGTAKETDPIFSASAAAGITAEDITEWNGKQDAINDLAAIRSGAGKGATAVQPSQLAEVATTGDYNDLNNKPTIPSAVTESTVSGWGFTKNTGTYSKPSGGIPKSDLAAAVQTSLGKADTALQSYTEQYKGTITGVSANGTSVATSGVANIPAASTSKYGVTKLSSATNSTSTTLAATASAVKAAYDLANGKQDKLVSGTNIKTINGTSILGSGDITISGGGSSGGSGAYSEVNHGTGDTTFTLTPNTFHIWDEVANLTLTLGSETSGVANEFLFQFTSGSEPTTLTMSDDIKWTEELVIEANRIYQISILKGLASTLNWEKTPEVTLITFYYNGTPYQAEEGMTWESWCSSTYNTDGFFTSYDYVLSQNVTYVCFNYSYVISTDVIMANAFYDNNHSGGGGGN